MKPIVLVLLVGMMALGNDGRVKRTPLPSPAALAPGRVSDLRVSAVTDTTAVLTWTEVSTGATGIAKYVVRFGPVASFAWGSSADIVTGGCAAPVYGSTAGGGRTRSCVLGGLQARRGYGVQIVAYTGTLNTNAIFGPFSNVATIVTAERVGPMLVQRPGLNMADSVFMRAVWFSAPGYSQDTLPLRGWFNVGAYTALGFFGDSVVLKGYLLVTRP